MFTLKILQGEKETCMEDYHLSPDIIRMMRGTI